VLAFLGSVLWESTEEEQSSDNTDSHSVDELSGVGIFGFSFVAKAASRFFAKRLNYRNNLDDPIGLITTRDELHCTIIMMCLELLEYINNERLLTLWGKALSIGSPSSIIVDNLQDEMLLVVELIRTGYLHANSMKIITTTPSPSTTHTPNTADFSKQITLISRVFCLIPMHFKGDKVWEAEIDHDLMAFNCIAKALSRSLRNLLEMILLALFLRNKSTIPYHQYANLSIKLPYFHEVNTAMGIVFKGFAVNGIRDPQSLANAFPACTNPWSDLIRAFNFWHQVFKVVWYLKQQSMISAELFEDFQNANSFLLQLIQ